MVRSVFSPQRFTPYSSQYIPHTCISITLGDLGKALFDCSSVCMSFAFGMALFKPLLYVSVGGHRWARGGRVLHPQASILDDPFVKLKTAMQPLTIAYFLRCVISLYTGFPRKKPVNKRVELFLFFLGPKSHFG